MIPNPDRHITGNYGEDLYLIGSGDLLPDPPDDAWDDDEWGVDWDDDPVEDEDDD